MSVPTTAAHLGAFPGVAMARHLVGPALGAAIDRLDGNLPEVCGYQLGLRDGLGRRTPMVGGKLLRPTFTLLAAQAAGGRPRAAVPAATAVELLHNASLIHDDIMDGDLERRHRPTVWARYGVPLATLAGDALIALGFEVLAETRHPDTGDAVAALATTLRLLAFGQDRDLDFETRAWVHPQECLSMMAGKTGVLLGCACRLGAMYAGAPPAVADAFDRCGTHLGVAFQLVDDILGIWGDPELTGKPVGADLRARKKSAPVVAAMSSAVAAATEVTARYTDPRDLDDAEVTRLADLIAEAGGREWTMTEVERQMAAAWAELDRLDLDPTARHHFTALAAALVNRDH